MPVIVMRTALLLPLLIASAVSSSGAQLLTSLGDPVSGERIFKEKACARCHGATAKGGAGPSLVGSARRQPLELAGIIWNHSPEMTAKARALRIPRPVLTGVETGDVLAFIYSLGFVDGPGDPKRGLVLLKDKQCLACHSSSDAAAGDAPRLKQLAKFGSSVAMLDAMWRHAADMQHEMRGQRVQRVAFAGDDMSHIVSYLHSIAGSSVKSTRLSGDARAGAQLFAVKGCSRCHAVYGFGGRVGPDLGTRTLPRTPSAIAGVLWNHGSRMRQLMDRYGVPQPTFERGELMNIVAYLYYLGFSDPAGDPIKGRVLFQKRGCARCHGTGTDTRTRIGPDLSRSQAALSPLEAARLMWEHAPKMEARLKEYGMTWPKFEGTELADLLAYLRTLPTTSAQ